MLGQFETTLLIGTSLETPILSRFDDAFVGPAATVITFAGSRIETMAGATYRHTGDHIATVLGGYHTSWNLPDHPGVPDPLTAWRARAEAGEPFVPNFVAKCVACLDDMISRQYTNPTKIALVAHSRGAMLAAHWAVIDSRIKVLVLVQPLVNPIRLTEWAGVSPLVAGPLALPVLAHRLADRRIWVGIGNNDLRVNTATVLSFTQQLQDWSTALTVNVFSETAPGHAPTPQEVLDDAASWLAAQI